MIRTTPRHVGLDMASHVPSDMVLSTLCRQSKLVTQR
jgi:hypothetical protein